MNAASLPLNVLHVDDDRVNLLVMDQILQAFGCRTQPAASAEEALAALSEEAFDIVLTDIAPYQRPPLSKAWLKGEADAESLALKPLEFYADHGIDFWPGVRGVQLRRSERSVLLSDGSTVAYDVLILATGARAIALPIPGADLEGVMFLRTVADAERLKATVGPCKRLAVVGDGYSGLEVAASGCALGAEVVVLEREDRILARVACPALSDFFRGYHE